MTWYWKHIVTLLLVFVLSQPYAFGVGSDPFSECYDAENIDKPSSYDSAVTNCPETSGACPTLDQVCTNLRELQKLDKQRACINDKYLEYVKTINVGTTADDQARGAIAAGINAKKDNLIKAIESSKDNLLKLNKNLCKSPEECAQTACPQILAAQGEAEEEADKDQSLGDKWIEKFLLSFADINTLLDLYDRFAKCTDLDYAKSYTDECFKEVYCEEPPRSGNWVKRRKDINAIGDCLFEKPEKKKEKKQEAAALKGAGPKTAKKKEKKQEDIGEFAETAEGEDPTAPGQKGDITATGGPGGPGFERKGVTVSDAGRVSPDKRRKSPTRDSRVGFGSGTSRSPGPASKITGKYTGEGARLDRHKREAPKKTPKKVPLVKKKAEKTLFQLIETKYEKYRPQYDKGFLR